MFKAFTIYIYAGQCLQVFFGGNRDLSIQDLNFYLAIILYVYVIGASAAHGFPAFFRGFPGTERLGSTDLFKEFRAVARAPV